MSQPRPYPPELQAGPAEPSEAELAKHREELTEKLKRAERELNGRRRVVQLVAPAHVPAVNLWLNDTCLVALCDDGTIWALRSGNWQPLKGPPGTEGGTP